MRVHTFQRYILIYTYVHSNVLEHDSAKELDLIFS